VPNPKCTKAGCGPWKPPEIANPKYKGKWTVPLIDNPLYKGMWKAKQVPNPDFVEDLEPAKHLAPMSAVAVEVSQIVGGNSSSKSLTQFLFPFLSRFGERFGL
jgi:calnexin